MAKNKIRFQKDSSTYYDIKVVPNQKVIKTKKVLPRGYILDILTNRTAQKELKPTTYVLYMHLLLNQPDYEEALSMQNVTNNTSLSERTYYSAVNELLEKGYLKKIPNQNFDEYYLLLESPTLACGDTPPPKESNHNADEADAESI